jgi:hypothetical protein
MATLSTTSAWPSASQPGEAFERTDTTREPPDALPRDWDWHAIESVARMYHEAALAASQVRVTQGVVRRCREKFATLACMMSVHSPNIPQVDVASRMSWEEHSSQLDVDALGEEGASFYLGHGRASALAMEDMARCASPANSCCAELAPQRPASPSLARVRSSAMRYVQSAHMLRALAAANSAQAAPRDCGLALSTSSTEPLAVYEGEAAPG